jgi:AcrR family transcriptional regulator
VSSHSRQTPRPVIGDSTPPDSAQAILAATEALLADSSLRDLSVAQIIARAGVSRATFYFHFASKFSVVASLVEQAIEEMYEVTRQTHRDNPSPSRSAALRQRIHDSARVWDAHRPVLKATVENWYVYPELGEAWLALIGGLTADIAEELEHQKPRRGVVRPDTRATGALLAWMTERCLYNVGMEDVVAADQRANYLEALTAVWISVMAPGELSAAYGSSPPGARAA